MKKYFKIFLLTIFLYVVCVFNVNAREINVYFFHGDGCPHCASEEEFFEKYKKDKDINIIKYEVWYDDSNSEFLEEVAKKMRFSGNGVPVTIIGDTEISGFSESISSKIDRAIEYYKSDDHGYIDVVSKIKDGTYESDESKEIIEPDVDDYGDDTSEDDESFEEIEKRSDESSTVSIPFFGKINLKKLSLSSSSVILGLIDGFNPCAMWVLLFLLSILIGMKDRKKMWIIGLSFLLTSGLVYFLIMMSWLNIVGKISTIIWVRNLIAIAAVAGGIYNVYNFFKSKDSGCNVVDDKKRKSIFSRIKKFCKEKNIFLAVLGACLLAVSVNLVELACSAGLPLLFGQLLALNNVSTMQGVFYTLLYIIFFMFDDILIFVIAMFTTKITAISTKYNKYSHLVGGIIMLLIGILLIFKPGWLMFNFK